MDVEIRHLRPGEEGAFVAEIHPWVALVEGRPAGIAALLDLRLTLPGGSRLPMAAPDPA
jgi:hypothetical protein